MHEILQEWLPGRRWFAGKGRDIAELSVASSPWLTRDPDVRIELAAVRYTDGETEIYQVPVEYRETPAEHLAHALIGSVEVPELGAGARWAYDALFDKDVTNAWLRGMHTGRHEEGLAFHQEPAAAGIPLEESSLVLTGEQSNTSLVFGDAVIMKVFRRLAEGLNPDVELHHALAEAATDHQRLLSLDAELRTVVADKEATEEAWLTLAAQCAFQPGQFLASGAQLASGEGRPGGGQ